jgi:hypothetical protein
MLDNVHLKLQIIVVKTCNGTLAKSEISSKTELKIEVAHSAHDWRKAKSAWGASTDWEPGARPETGSAHWSMKERNWSQCSCGVRQPGTSKTGISLWAGIR